MTCRLCGLDKPLIDAHIIPRPFFTVPAMLGSGAKVLSDKSGEFPKRSRTGIYDPGILCAPCDREIGVWDQYGVELLCHGLADFARVASSSGVAALVLPSFDYHRLKLFFMSVLWRAGVSSHPFFRRVQLGPHAERLGERLLARDPGAPEDYSVALSAFTVGRDVPPEGLPIMDPFRERWSGVNAYRVSLGVVAAYVKVDKVRFTGPLSNYCLRPGERLVLVAREFGRSRELRVIDSITALRKHHRLFPERLPPASSADDL